MTEFGEGMMWLAFGGASVAVAVLLYPLVQAVAERIRGKGRPEIAGDEARIADLEARLDRMEQRAPITGEVEAQGQRMAELEERLDFAERVLTTVDASRALPHGPGGQLDSWHARP